LLANATGRLKRTVLPHYAFDATRTASHRATRLGRRVCIRRRGVLARGTHLVSTLVSDDNLGPVSTVLCRAAFRKSKPLPAETAQNRRSGSSCARIIRGEAAHDILAASPATPMAFWIFNESGQV